VPDHGAFGVKKFVENKNARKNLPGALSYKNSIPQPSNILALEFVTACTQQNR
jgi:hypothetical protein